jgi:hypothetical protein
MRLTRCNCHTLTCILDNLNHALGSHLRWICDRHDAYILGERIGRLER